MKNFFLKRKKCEQNNIAKVATSATATVTITFHYVVRDIEFLILLSKLFIFMKIHGNNNCNMIKARRQTVISLTSANTAEK